MSDEREVHPTTLTIDYPEEKRDRLTCFFRPFVAIPVAIVLGLISGTSPGFHHDAVRVVYGAGGIIFIPVLLMLLFRAKYPRWWFDWNLGLMRFSLRVAAFFALLRDEYPSTDEEQAVHLDIAYPDAKSELHRGMPLVKWLLAIPHYIVLLFLVLAAIVCTLIAWFTVLFAGRYPRAIFGFVVGVMRWEVRVVSYAFLLTSDDYPPFSLEE